MERFKDKVAIVTGANGGIGTAIVKRLLDEGCRVILAVRRPDAGERARAQAADENSPESVVVECDVSDPADVEACCDEAIKRWGRIDAIVNNAGLMAFKPIVDLDEDDWLTVLKVDLLGCAHFMRSGFKRMKPGSAIVNIASIHAIMTTPDVAPYAAAKAAAVSLSRSGAIEGRPLGIRVNALLPGAIDTPMLWDNPNIKSGVEKIDKADVGKPEDIAAATAFLASDDAAFVTGTTLIVDGGRLARL
ncbi:MAG TPA: SDR family oxidoreductase [Caulobacteraceae bacterium]|jgi:NAD(P)-dependent dehydrogenase (short-subunit alcohol dehydrogenase family)|nr:SDR family oxidoreductase [Caulobacteraceae bacterium]